jgi:Raf kinase inhibitor-like YbhB/YbcL family protein
MQEPTFSLSSTAFEEDGAIPRRHTCDGEDASPDLTWAGAPDGTMALALIVTDPDARAFVHWIAFDLTGTPSGGLPTAVSSSPDAPPQGTNGFGRAGYGGPCPPSGTHRYVFTLIALDQALGLTGAPRLEAVERAMDGHVLARATLRGNYHR